jgi:hypothetical protein
MNDSHIRHSSFVIRPLPLDPGLLLALALALVAALPFFTRPGLPRGTDAELHVYRAAELGYSLRAGDLYPRWAPDFYYGYGYPIFNYYAPFTYFLANLFDLMPGFDIIGGVKFIFILGLVAAALGVYVYVRDWLGPRPGLLAAALYVFSPYVFFVDPHMRGVLAESFSLGLFPLALWAYRRTRCDPRRRWLVLAALLQAALITTHNLLGAVCTALLLAHLIWERFVLRRSSFVAFILGLGLSAIFWLPMVSEQGAVQLTLTGPGHFDFHNHFVSPGELFGPSPALDLGAANPDFAFNLGLPQWPLALLALLPLLRDATGRRAGDRRQIAFFVLSALALVFLMLPTSTPVWEIAPGLELLQFPWRLLGPAAAMLSIAAATGYDWIARRTRWSTPLLGAGIGLTLLLALPAMFPPEWEADFGPTDPAAMIQFELTGVAVGTTSTSDFLPVAVEIQPHPEPTYLAAYPDKVNRATLPQATVVETLSHGPTHDRFHTESHKPFLLRLFTFYWPGWQASVDGRPVEIQLGRPEGFIIVPVPAGVHTVEVRLGSTLPRTAGALVSLLSLVALLMIAVSGYSPRSEAERDQSSAAIVSAAKRSSINHQPPVSPIVGGVILAFLLFKVVWVDPHPGWFRRTSPPGQVLGTQHSLADAPIRFGEHIQLLGYDLPTVQARPGDSLPLTLYWRATGPVLENYQVFAHLTHPAAAVWGQSDHLNPGDLPTSRWTPDKYVADAHALTLSPDTPSGDYQLSVGLYTLANDARAPVFAADGAPLGDAFTLPATVQVTQP